MPIRVLHTCRLIVQTFQELYFASPVLIISGIFFKEQGMNRVFVVML